MHRILYNICSSCVPRYRKWTVWHVLAAIVCLIVCFNEYLSYSFNSLTWPSLHLPDSRQSDTVRLMFVADPQLQGNEDELAVIGVFTRWDADTYLSRTFRRAYSHIQPDVVIFMGDLLDEGSKASDADYEDYYQRFQNIFRVPPHVKSIYLAGDNDVGGEGFDIRLDWKVSRFQKFFLRTRSKPPLVINHKFLDFFDLDMNSYNKASPEMKRNIERMRSNSSAPYRILLNHMGLLDSGRDAFHHIIQQIKASIAFTAHTHYARLRTCLDCREAASEITNTHRYNHWKGTTEAMEDRSVYSLDISGSVTFQEVVVPTASYRMGVPHMGYGSAVVDLQGHMKYAVLWCPSRYRQLLTYLFLGLILLGVFAVILFRQLLLCVRVPDWHSPSLGPPMGGSSPHFPRF